MQSFYLTHNFRWVRPYFFAFEVFVKGRWIGRTVIDVLSHEFPYYSEEYYINKISAQLITVDGHPCLPTDVLQNNQTLRHYVHRHESPVLRSPEITILRQTADFLVINKPPSIPVHACGRYRKNTVCHILRTEFGLEEIWPVHRLDRLTSGVLLFGRTKEETALIASQIVKEGRADETKAEDAETAMKTYLARVRGRFPLSAEVNLPIYCADKRVGIFACAPHDGEEQRQVDTVDLVSAAGGAAAEAPLDPEGMSKNQWKKVQRALARGKPVKKKGEKTWPTANDAPKAARTLFQGKWYDPETDHSLVMCFPKTGRTHQIRLHLQSLDHPILNDPCYGNAPCFTEPPKPLPPLPPPADNGFGADERVPSWQAATAEEPEECEISGPAPKRRRLESLSFQHEIIAHCPDCPESTDPPPDPNSLFICLHAVALELDLGGTRERIEAPPPWWAEMPKTAVPITAEEVLQT
eukprot:TRINITY_DN20246_c0_g1_i1.p1 TRINITY_DN20246_c0_g1~~TRINITY_DN20246_c0_g1_i1.p1  ORF type:complete len:467 (+),score=62.34 TRINITY_DN20246_c0_g1_i1:27-1427(+)